MDDIDYCTVRPSDNYLFHKGNSETNLGLCEGDCDKDDDCATGFYCFKRVRFNSVPGCEVKGALVINLIDNTVTSGMQ